MYDTVKLRSGWLPSAVGLAVERRLTRLQELDGETGEIAWEMCRGGLLGSFDHRLSVRTQWQTVPDGESTLEECRVTVEGSIHKAIMGHNVYGGPVEIVPACRWLVAELGRRLDVALPDGLTWEPMRVDVAEAYDLGRNAAVLEYIRGMNHLRYPRRVPNRYGGTGLMWAGTTSTVKVYAKMQELLAHDGPRLRQTLDAADYAYVVDCADPVLRVEVEVKSKALVAMFGPVQAQEVRLREEVRSAVAKTQGRERTKVTVAMLDDARLSGLHDREWARVIAEGQEGMETVRAAHEVRQRLVTECGCEMGSRLFGTWLQLAAIGEEATRETMSRPTWYRHRATLARFGCSWVAADVMLAERESAIPSGFSPERSDCRRLCRIAEEVEVAVAGYRMVA